MNELSTEETGYRNLLMLAEKGARASDILRELGVPSLAIQEEVSEWTLQKITAAKNRKDDATPNPPWAPPPQTQAAPLYPFPDGHYVNRSPGDFPTVNRTAPRPKPKSEALNDPYRAKPPAQQYAQARPRPPAPLSTGSTPTATSNVGHSRTHSGSSPLFIPGQNSFENYNYDPYSSNSYNPYSTQQPFYDENYNYSNPYYSNYGYGSWDPTNTNSGVHFGGTTYYQLPSTIPPQDTQATSTNSPTAPITTPTQPNILAEQVTQHSLIPAVHKYKPETDASRSISPLNKRVPHPAPIKDPTQPPPPVTAHHTQAPVPVQRPEKKQPAVKCEGGTQTTPPKQRPPPKTKVPEVKSSAGTSTESKPPAASPPLRYQHPQTSPSPVKLLSPRAVLSPNKIRPVQSPRRVPGMCWADDTDGMEELHKDLSNEIVDNNNNISNEDKDRHKVKPRVVERNKSSWEDIGRQRDEWYARRKQIIDSPVRKQPQIQVVSPDQPGPRSMRGRGVQPITENAWSKGNPWTTNRRDHEDNPEQESEHNIDQPDWEDHPIDGEIVPNEEDNTEKQEGNNGNYGRQFGRGAWGRQGRNFSGRGRGHPNGENNQQEDGENRNRRDGRQNRPYQDRGRGRGDRGQQGERAERADRGEGRPERADRGGAREERGRGRGRGRGKPISESTPTVEDTKQQSDAQPKQKVIQTVPIRADVIKPVQTGFSYASIARTNMTEKGHGEVQHIPQEEVKENDETHNEGDEEQTDAAAVVTEKPVQHRPARNAWNKSLVPTERVENNAPVDSEDNIENKTENETTTTSDEANSNYNRGRGRGRGRGGRDQAPFERRGYRGNNNTDRNQQYEARDNERRQNRGRQTEQNNENKDETKKPEGNNMALAPGQTWASKLRGNRVSDKPDLKFDESADTTTTTESTDKSVAVVKGAWAKGSPIASTVTGYPSDRDINKPELTGLPRERLAPLGRGAGRIVVDDIKPITTTTTPPQETPPPAEQQQQPSPKLAPAPTPVAPKPSPVKEEPTEQLKVPHTPHEEAPHTKKDTPDHQNQNQQRPPKQPKPQYQKPAQQPRREKQVTPKEDTKPPRDVDAESHESAPAPPKQKPQKPKPEAPVEPKVEERPKSTTESEIKLEVEEPKVDVRPQTSPKSSPRVEKTRAASPIKPGKVEQQDKDNEVSQERPKPQRKEKEPRQHPQEHVHESVKEEVQVHEEKPADHHVPETREIESPHTVTAKVEHTTEPKPAEVTPELPKPKVTEKEKKNKPKPEPVQEEAEGSEGEQGGDSTKRRRRKRKTKEEATEPAPKETEPEPVVVEEEVEVAQKPVNLKPKKQAQPPPNEGIISKAISLVSNWMWGAPAEPPKAAPKPHKPPTKATKKKGKK